jgi:LPXTG-motif cell wall-anchored protein
MKLLQRLLNHVRYASSSKLLVAALFVALTGVALSANIAAGGTAAGAATCKTNNILPCGTGSVTDFVNQYKTNKTGDLPAIYAAFGLQPGEIDRFAHTAKMGVAYRDGTVKVDGKVVATNGNSLGREKKSYSKTVNIGGKTYYADRDQDAFLSDIPALVLMNGDQFEFAALTACGNPVKGTPTGKAPEYSCNMLNVTQTSRTDFTYTTDVTALHGASVAKLVYDFGDGKTQTVTSAAQSVNHTYAKEGTYTTKVTVYVTVNGESKAVTGAKCAKPVEVKPAPQTPVYACDALTATTISKENRQYRFTVTTAQSGGATLSSASFNFGDNQSINGVKPSDSSTISAEHTYAAAGTYTIVATVNFNVASGVKSVTCKAQISPQNTPPAECKPGIPVGDSRCTETPVTPPAATPTTPQQLPNTGVGDVLGGTIGTGSILTAGGYFVRSRRNLISTFLRR